MEKNEEIRKIVIEGFSVIEDTRCQCDVKHPLVNVLILIMSAILCGLDTIESIVEYGKNKKEFLKEVFNIEKIPSEATVSRVLNIINAEQVSECIISIMKELLKGREIGDIIAIDGKAISSTSTMKKYNKTLYILTAYATKSGLVIGQTGVQEKTNEIPCVQEMLEVINIENKVVTADAMHCQKETVKKIIERKGNYVIGVKGNQHNFYNDIDERFKELIGSKKPIDKAEYEYAKTEEKNRDRIEKRECYLLKDIEWLKAENKWKNLEGVFAVVRTTERNEKISQEINYYITSLREEPINLMKIVREHWKIESMHYQLDVTYSEDNCRIINETSQKTLNAFRKLGLFIHKQYKEKTGSKKPMTRAMFKCLLDNNALLEMLQII